jgi:hypothetical protein
LAAVVALALLWLFHHALAAVAVSSRFDCCGCFITLWLLKFSVFCRGDQIDVYADAKALNITAFTGPPKIETLRTAQGAVGEARPFVVEPRQWGQTRFQYFCVVLCCFCTISVMVVIVAWTCILMTH